MSQAALTIVGTAVGYVIGGPYGAALGSTIGGAAGSVLFPTQIEGPRLNELQVTTSSYGKQLPLVYGAENRVAGNIIWASGLKEHKETETQGKGGAEVTTYTYSTSIAIALSQGPCGGIKKIWGNRKLLWDADEVSTSVEIELTSELVWAIISGEDYPLSPVKSVRFYPGNFTQDPDSVIQSHLGIGNTPAYRGTCYVVLEDLQLADFGNTIPALEFELVGISGDTIGVVAKDICVRAGLVDGEFSVNSSLDTLPLRGYNLYSAANAAAALSPLQAPGQFDASERYGAVMLSPRYRGPLATIEADLMSARQWNDGDAGQQPRIQGKRVPDHALPKEVSVSFIDPERDYQVNTQRATTTRVTSQTIVSIEAPITLGVDEARKLADRALWEAFGGRTEYRFSLPPDFDFLGATDKIVISFSEYLQLVRMSSVTRGDNRVRECVALSEDVLAYEGSEVGASAFVPVQTPAVVGETFVYVFDSPMLVIGAPEAGISYVVYSPDAGWRGGIMLRSTDGGQSWVTVSSHGSPSVVGDVVGVLGGCDDPNVWDEASVLTVQLSVPNATLSSRPEEEVYATYNAAWVGRANGSTGEVLQFRDATLVGPGKYELRGLLRGRRGTEYAIDDHTFGEVFVLIQSDTVYSMDAGLSDLNLTRNYSGISLFQPIIDAVSQQSIANTGERLRPRSPVHVRGERDGSNNLTITWIRRTRVNGPWLGYGAVPLDESQERYEIDIVDGGGDVVRTLVSTSPTVTYGAGQQSSDGFAPGAPISGNIYQISTVIGRGRPRSFTV